MLISVTNIFLKISATEYTENLSFRQSPTGCSWSRIFHTHVGAQLLLSPGSALLKEPLHSAGAGAVLHTCKRPNNKYLGLSGHIVSDATSPLYHCSTKTAIQRSGQLCASTTLFTKTGSKPDLAHKPHLPTLAWTCAGLCKRLRSDIYLFH